MGVYCWATAALVSGLEILTMDMMGEFAAYWLGVGESNSACLGFSADKSSCSVSMRKVVVAIGLRMAGYGF